MTTDKNPVLEVRDLKVHFPIPKARTWFWQSVPRLKAVDGVSFKLYQGETPGIVGESGCGKSTLARALIDMAPATEGAALWLGRDLLRLAKSHSARSAGRFR